MTKRKTPLTAAAAAAMPTGAQTDVPGPRSRNSVTVACKLPHGLILRLFKQIDIRVPVLGGGFQNEKRAQQIGESVTIKGNASPQGLSPEHKVVGGYGLTSGVDAEFFREWLKQNEDSDAVRNGLIFANEKAEHVTGQAKEQRALRSGLERIDVSKGTKDPRMLKGIKKFEGKEEEEAA